MDSYEKAQYFNIQFRAQFILRELNYTVVFRFDQTCSVYADASYVICQKDIICYFNTQTSTSMFCYCLYVEKHDCKLIIQHFYVVKLFRTC
jgi:hypothetical protein